MSCERCSERTGSRAAPNTRLLALKWRHRGGQHNHRELDDAPGGLGPTLETGPDFPVARLLEATEMHSKELPTGLRG